MSAHVSEPFQMVASDASTIKLVGDLDLETVASFESALAEATSTADRPFRLDLSELSFIDAAGLHALERHARALNGGGPLVITNLPAFARRVFAIVGLDRQEAITLT
ncbi:MAG TPA: STAS domain-containing protein [Gaiella sp.]|nr:STAS domain-containing protein [Gaiella sp.]